MHAAPAASRVLFTAWPFAGHLFPQVAVAHALRRQGHDVAFYTGARAADIVRSEGFTCFPFRCVDEAAIERLMRDRPSDPWRLTRIPRLGRLLRQWLLETVPQQVVDLEPIVADWSPSVIATDPTLWAPLLVLGESRDIPVAVCSFVPAWMVPPQDGPPFGPGLPSRGSRRDRWLGRGLMRINRIASKVGVRQANEIRAAHRLPPLTASSVTEHAGRMPLYLIPGTPELDYGRRDLPPTAHYVGPLLWNRPATEASTFDRDAIDPGVWSVHVSEGTVHVQRPFLLKAAVDGLRDAPVQVIATTGGHRSVEELGLGALPGNVQLTRWVSHDELLPRVDVVVTTGGAGTVMASLAAGVPLVIVPTEWDKPEIAQRVVEAGAALRLSPARCTPARLRASVLEVLENPSFRTAARRLAAAFARQGGARRAAELIVALDRAHGGPVVAARPLPEIRLAACQGA